MRKLILITLMMILTTGKATAGVDVGIIIHPYAGDRAGPARDDGAQAMTQGMATVIAAAGGQIRRKDIIALSAEDEKQYGRWNRFGLASGHPADQVSENYRNGLLNVGFYNNCSSLMAMLGEAIRVMFQYPKTQALGLASYPHTKDPGLLTLNAIHLMVAGALQGIQER